MPIVNQEVSLVFSFEGRERGRDTDVMSPSLWLRCGRRDVRRPRRTAAGIPATGEVPAQAKSAPIPRD